MVAGHTGKRNFNRWSPVALLAGISYLSFERSNSAPVSSETTSHYPALARPPIAEVVCGFVFSSIPELDALLLGTYWDLRKDEFPSRSLQPAIVDETATFIEPFATRAFLTSKDEQFVLQLQHDRFFINWRARGQVYPRFSDRHGSGGLLVRAMEEFEKFCSFVERRVGFRPMTTRIELSKIDLLHREQHWSDLNDLAALMPVTDVFAGMHRSQGRELNLRFVERLDGDLVVVHVATVNRDEKLSLVRIESRCVAKVKTDILSAFEGANQILNDVFFKLVKDSPRRFGARGESGDA